MATVREVATEALQELGLYGATDTASADDAKLCLDAINNILDGWRLESLNLYASQAISFALPAATLTRTIGPAMQVAVARPVRLEAGCYITADGIDLPLIVISKQQYNELVLKTLDGGWPLYVMYDDTYPTGTLYFWPQGACTVNLVVQVPITAPTAITTELTLPPGYQRALSLTLTEEIAAKFQKEVSKSTATKAAHARRVLKRSNVVVPQLDMCAHPFNERWYLGVP